MGMDEDVNMTPIVPMSSPGPDQVSSLSDGEDEEEGQGNVRVATSKSGFSSSSGEAEEPAQGKARQISEKSEKSGFSDSSSEEEEEAAGGEAVAASKSGRSGLSASSSEESAHVEPINVQVIKAELRPELTGQLIPLPGKLSAADSAALAVQNARRSSVTKKAAPSLRAFNDQRRKSASGPGGGGSKTTGRRQSRVVVADDEVGGAAEKIERQRRMSMRPAGPDPPKSGSAVPEPPRAASQAPSNALSLPGALPDTSPSPLQPASPTNSHAMTVFSRRTSVAPKMSQNSSAGSQRTLRGWQKFKAELVPNCRLIIRSKIFLLIMFAALLMALFLPDIWILADRDTNTDLDILLTIIFLMFAFEFVIQCIGMRQTYINSFFFYMDILGAFSLLLDMNYIGIQAMLQSAGGVGNQVVIARAARIAKLGARVGRFTKLVKLLRFLPGMGDQAAVGSARVINSRLTHSLSTRVSCLIILLVLVIPLFTMWSFPQDDGSLMAWSRRLDNVAVGRPEVLTRELEKLDAFYTSLNYFPYQVEVREGVTLPNSTMLPWSTRSTPVRSDGKQVYESTYLRMRCNFTGPNQMDSAMNLLLLFFIMILMVGFSMVLQRTTSKMVLHPVERLLTQVKDTAATVFESVPDLGGGPEEENDSNEDGENEDGTWKEATFKPEIHLLDKVVQKVTDLQKREDKSDQSSQWTGIRAVDKEEVSGGKAKRSRVAGSLFMGEEAASGDVMTVVMEQHKLLEDSGLSVEGLNTWMLSPLEFDRIMNRAVAGFIVGPANHGIRCEEFLPAFIDEVEAGHSKTNPYHNWFHAVDVAHTTWRLASVCNCIEYLSYHETLAMLVAALCHDLGHPGVSNKFLVETRHELAMTYNDRSCLENMSCARLWEIVKQPRCAIFKPLSANQYNVARKACVQAILNTDNAQHFQSVKKVQMFYEMNSEVLTAAAEMYRESLEEDEEPVFPMPEVSEVFKEASNKQTLINLMVHLADTSNACKPFRICQTWVQKAMEENFLQGDEEKLLGLPVQALNDREKANLPHSQIGFIEYLVAPFLLVVIKVLPPADALQAQLLINVKTWEKLWQQQGPSDEEKQKVAARVKDMVRAYNEAKKAS